MVGKSVIIFDADDTLFLGTTAVYSKAIVLFHFYLHEIFGPRMVSHSDFVSLFKQIEDKAVKTWSVKYGRITQSMLKTYWEICRWAELRFGFYFSELEHKKHEVQIRKLGDLPFDHFQVQWFLEAEPLLKKLESVGHTLCLLTNYDPDKWPERERLLEVGKFFPKKHILSVLKKKTPEDFIKVSGWNEKVDKKRLWIAIGNAPVDVVTPLAISANWWGIHIPYGGNSSIHSESKEVNLFPKIDHPKVINITSLRGLASALNLIEIMSAP